MKLLFLSNNIEIVTPLVDWLKFNAKEDITLYSDKLDLEVIRKINPYMIISYNYKYIIKEEILDFVQNRAINLHISLLPWNRGAHPNLWSFLKDTPKGVTIHIIDKGIDTGDILFQKELLFDENVETLETSYKKLHQEMFNLFIENWEKIKYFKIKPIKQDNKGIFHSVRDFEEIKSHLGENIFNESINILKKRYKENLNEYSK